MFSEEEIKQIKKDFIERFDAIVKPKNLTPEQEQKLMNYLINRVKINFMNCVDGHDHIDAMERYDENSPWVCLTCGKQFADIEFVRKLHKEMYNQ